MAVEASIIIEFGEGVSTGSVIVELDDQHANNLDAAGKLKSSFSPGDTPVFLLQYDPALVNISAVKSTDGGVARIGTQISRSRKMSLLFTSLTTTINLSYSNVESASYTWYGNTGAAYIANGSFKLTSGDIPCSSEAVYDVMFQEQWQLNPPPLTLTADETYTIYVVIYAEVA